MNVLITGTTGFVGKYLRAALIEDGYSIKEVNRKKSIEGSYSYQEVYSGLCSSNIWIHLAGNSKDVDKKELLPEYLEANVSLTKKVFDSFLQDETATVFIFISSVKAAASKPEHFLTEEDDYEVKEPYGLSKGTAEKILLSTVLPSNKKLIILRPAMIYGYTLKSNLYSLFSFVKKGLPYPFAAFNNSRTMLSINNFIFVIRFIIDNSSFRSGIYNVADDEALSTPDIITLMSSSLGRKPRLWALNQNLIKKVGIIGDKLHLPINTNKLNKLTGNYIVSNRKLIKEMSSVLPFNTTNELLLLFKQFPTVRKT